MLRGSMIVSCAIIVPEYSLTLVLKSFIFSACRYVRYVYRSQMGINCCTIMLCAKYGCVLCYYRTRIQFIDVDWVVLRRDHD